MKNFNFQLIHIIYRDYRTIRARSRVVRKDYKLNTSIYLYGYDKIIDDYELNPNSYLNGMLGTQPLMFKGKSHGRKE